MGQDHEPRSFVPVESNTVGELSPIDPTRLTQKQQIAALFARVDQVHGCVEEGNTKLDQHIREQGRVNAASTLADLAIREDLQKVTLALGIRAPEAGEAKPKGTIATWGPVKVLTAISGMSFALVLLVQLSAKVAPVVWAYLLTLSP